VQRLAGRPTARSNAATRCPQSPTGLRSIAELIETLRLRGGGLGLSTGCAAGDTGAAIVREVTD
jgi:acetyl-CoA C-acetyltransferase